MFFKKVASFLIALFLIPWSVLSYNPPHSPIEKKEFSIFSRENCVHCIQLKKFLDENVHAWNVTPKYYDIDIPENRELFEKFTTKHNIHKVTPIILIGDTVIIGYQSKETTGKQIEKLISNLTESSYFEDAIDKNIQTITSVEQETCSLEGMCSIPSQNTFTLQIPLIGSIEIRTYSLLLLSMILGFVDGFNPCAMWVLVMFLGLLLHTRSIKKMIQIAGTFLLAETITYYLILTLWYNTWNFITLDSIITPLVGILSLWSGIYFLYEFFWKKDIQCKVIPWQKKQTIKKTFEKIIHAPFTFSIFLLTIFLAFSINIIEFACSIGIPQAYTKLLEMSDISFLQKNIYMFIYIFFYMLDDILVFLIALYSFDRIHITQQYTRYSLLIGGIIMVILGYFFIFDPATLKSIIS